MSKNILTNQLNYFKYTLITLVLRWLSRFHCIHLVLTFFVYKFTVIKSVSYKYGIKDAHLENHGERYVFISYNVHVRNTPSEAGILNRYSFYKLLENHLSRTVFIKE